MDIYALILLPSGLRGYMGRWGYSSLFLMQTGCFSAAHLEIQSTFHILWILWRFLFVSCFCCRNAPKQMIWSSALSFTLSLQGKFPWLTCFSCWLLKHWQTNQCRRQWLLGFHCKGGHLAIPSFSLSEWCVLHQLPTVDVCLWHCAE